jgi:2-oxoglutarate dehydrogenase E2 component (dihydrolipoamide succinyltransferase)
MAKTELIMPKMGESIMEATILKWLKQPGDTVEQDETILEIATDKVDSEIPSPVSGVVSEILFQENDVVEIGKVIAVIATEGADVNVSPSPAIEESSQAAPTEAPAPQVIEEIVKPLQPAPQAATISSADRFYSPLVKNIAKTEGIGQAELDAIPGTGSDGRVTKHDILQYLQNRVSPQSVMPTNGHSISSPASTPAAKPASPAPVQAINASGDVEIIEMDRMRRMISEHMTHSKKTSAHVTSFVEVDVTNIVNWREKNKALWQKKYGEKITYTPIFVDAVVRAIKDFPNVNASVDGDKIIVKKYINIGMAAALPSGNLIVPVIKNADYLNLAGLTKTVNDLASRARQNKLKPEEVQDGTFTITNVGTFGNVMGTPIINQPQVAIMATGAIRKKPAVLETEHGDVIAIRQMMFLSLSYDHRVVDGMLGGSFLKRVGDYLEAFDTNTPV